MKTGFLTMLALGAFLACGGGSYSNPEPDVQVRTDDGDTRDAGGGDGADRANSASMDRAVRAAREVLSEAGWTVFRVDRSGTDRVIEARRGGNELLRIYLTPNEGEVGIRGWHQKDGEPQPNPHEILEAIELRIKTGASPSY